MNTHDKYELPPLPPLHIAPSVEPVDYPKVAQALMDYARSAIEPYAKRIAELEAQIEAYRQRRGEPVAWLYEDELPDNYPYEAMFPYSKVDGVRMFPVYAPQPAEPVKRKRRYAQGTALGEFGIIPMCDQVDDEPVKVPSDTDIDELSREWGLQSAAYPSKSMVRDFARALLARYGQQAQPAASTAPVSAQSSVPEPLKYGREWKDHYVTGWNNCRAAMLAAEQPQQDDPTPEEEEAWQRMERRS